MTTARPPYYYFTLFIHYKAESLCCKEIFSAKTFIYCQQHKFTMSKSDAKFVFMIQSA